jgi:hypothetical protein
LASILTFLNKIREVNVSYFKGLKELIGTVCGSAAGAAITGVDLAKKLGKKSTEILFYICGGGFIALGVLTRRGGNQPPAQVAPPPPPPAQQQQAVRPQPPGARNVRPARGGNRYMRRPGANRPDAPGQQPPPPGFVVARRGRVIRIISPQEFTEER